MSAILAFIITLAEAAIVVASAVLQSHNILWNALVYGSPFYLAMNLLGADSALWDKNPFYLGMLLFHLVKYFIIFRAQVGDDYIALRRGAIVMEVAYLAVSAYYNN